MSACEHMSDRPAEPVGDPVCGDCVERGDRWVHLRVCATCGKIACCDSSPNRHATRHADRSGHPVVRSYEPGERWWWCYVDEELAAARAGFPPARVD